MKIMKKLMALALASALALTLLTGCGGGGGGGGAISDGNGGTITISGTQNANTEFSKAFINAQASTGINMSYEAAKGAKAQKFMEVVVDLAKKNPNQKLDEQFVLKILDKAGIDVTEEMVFMTDKTNTTYQMGEIRDQMSEWKSGLADEGVSIDYNGATFGYIVAKNGEEQLMCIVVGYTATK